MQRLFVPFGDVAKMLKEQNKNSLFSQHEGTLTDLIFFNLTDEFVLALLACVSSAIEIKK